GVGRGRREFDCTAPTTRVSPKAPATVDVAGHFLYGAPAAGLDLEGDVTVAKAKERPGYPGYEFGLADDEVSPSRQTLEDLPATDDAGKAKFNVSLDKLPASTRPLEAKVAVR